MGYYTELFFFFPLLFTKINFRVYKYLIVGSKEHEARLFSVLSHDSTGGNGHKLKYRQFHLKVSKCFYSEDCQTLAQVALKSCEVFVFGDFQNQTEMWSRAACSTWPCGWTRLALEVLSSLICSVILLLEISK